MIFSNRVQPSAVTDGNRTVSVASIVVHDNRCGRARLSDGRPCQQRTGGGPCQIHQELPGPAHDALAVTNVVRAFATAARDGSDAQRAARHLVKILSAAESLEEARAAVHTSPTVSNREAMIRLLDAAEVRTSAAAIENIVWNVEDLWQRFRLATVLSDTVPDADYELEVDPPGVSGGPQTWKDEGPWRHSGNTRKSCGNAR